MDMALYIDSKDLDVYFWNTNQIASTLRWSYQERFRDGKHGDCGTYLPKSINKDNSAVEIECKRKKADWSNDLFIKILGAVLKKV